MQARFLVLAQWVVVYVYAKFGYFDTVNAADWARFFYVSNQLIMCAWIYTFIECKPGKSHLMTAFIFNFLLAILWAHHYIPVFHEWIDTYGIVEPVLIFMIFSQISDYVLTYYIQKKDLVS